MTAYEILTNIGYSKELSEMPSLDCLADTFDTDYTVEWGVFRVIKPYAELVLTFSGVGTAAAIALGAILDSMEGCKFYNVYVACKDTVTVWITW
jgi:hypothetical protein